MKKDYAERNRQIARMYADGKGMKLIAACFDVTPQRVSQILKKLRIPAREHGPSHQRQKEAAE